MTALSMLIWQQLLAPDDLAPLAPEAAAEEGFLTLLGLGLLPWGRAEAASNEVLAPAPLSLLQACF